VPADARRTQAGARTNARAGPCTNARTNARAGPCTNARPGAEADADDVKLMPKPWKDEGAKKAKDRTRTLACRRSHVHVDTPE